VEFLNCQIDEARSLRNVMKTQLTFRKIQEKWTEIRREGDKALRRQEMTKPRGED